MGNNKLLLGFAILLCIIPIVSAQNSVCGSNVLWFQHQNSPDIPDYEELLPYPSGEDQVDESVTIKNTDGPVLIDTYIMEAGSITDATILSKGLRTFLTYHYVDGASGITQINFTAFQRFQNGTEVVFYSQLTEDIDSLTPIAYTTYRVSPNDLILNPTDRLGIKVYGQTTHSSPITVHFLYQGVTNTSHFQTGYFECPYVSTRSGSVIPMNRVPTSPLLPILGICLCLAFLSVRNYL
jgi:hypothetical protein